MNDEFKKLSQGDVTRYVLESATSMGSGSIASMPMSMGGMQRRKGDNLIAQESDKKKVPASTPRNFVAKNAKSSGAGAHKDKKKEAKQGNIKHKKPYMEALQARLDQLKSKVAEGFDSENNPWHVTDVDAVSETDFEVALQGPAGIKLNFVIRPVDFVETQRERYQIDSMDVRDLQSGKTMHWGSMQNLGKWEPIFDAIDEHFWMDRSLQAHLAKIVDYYMDAGEHGKNPDMMSDLDKRDPNGIAVSAKDFVASHNQADAAIKSAKKGVAEGSEEAEKYKAHLLKTAPRIMDFLAKTVKGWRPSEQEMLGAIDTAYTIMKHTGDVKQAGKAMMDELNTLHRMSQGQQGVAEARMSAAQRLWNAEQKQRAKSNASLARTPSSIPKPEPKKDEKTTEKLKTGPAAHFTPKDAHVKRGQFVGGDAGSVDEEKQRLDPSCWKGYKKQGTKMKGDTRVNNCVKVSEDVENIMDALINKIIINEAVSNNRK